MKKIITILIVLFSFSLAAQQIDTLSIGAGYTQQVWYNVATGAKTQAPALNWDVAFSMRARVDAAIWVNPNATLYRAIAPASAWATVNVDTTTLTPQYGVDSTWSMGAFNRTGDNNLNYGWGSYNPVTHNVVGDSIYIIKNLAGKWQKILIDKMPLDTSFIFKYANLDGTNEKIVEIRKTQYTNRLMSYYSLVNHTILDREPAIKEWDLTAFRYYGLVSDNTGYFQDYPLTGILQNPNVTIAKAVKRDTANDSYSGLTFSNRVNVIGADWKVFDLSTGWKVADSTVYFIKSQNGKIYKIIFTKFGGSSNGNMIFTKEALTTTSVRDESGSKSSFAIYPNPVQSDNINLIYSIHNSTETIDFQLINLAGQIVFTQKLKNTEGVLQQQNISIPNLNAGLYAAHLSWNGQSIVQKVLVQN
ncbi:MAG: T9SS type A sorting domain-containing protein [Saprospiraceae bacterium]|nr:T9SS type A sorting domain-containing protein [Saprospiraceae bacterium]